MNDALGTVAFESSVYVERREKLLSGMKHQGITDGLIVILGATDIPLNASNQNINVPFRQTSNLAYYFGPTGYSSSLITGATIDVQTGEATLFGKPLSDSAVVREGAEQRVGVDAFAEALHINSKLLGNNEEHDSILDYITSTERPFFLFPENNPEWHRHLMDKLQFSMNEIENGNSPELRNAIIEQRLIKSLEEIAKLKDAGARTREIIMHLLQNVTPNWSEAEVNAKIQQFLAKQNAAESFRTIVSTNGHVLHNRSKREIPMGDNQLLLVDTGVQPMTHNYCGDQTLTFPTGEKFTDKQAEIFTLVTDAHRAAAAKCKIGINFKEVHFEACRVIIEGLKKIGILKGDTESILESGAHALFFPHGLGHAIGLDDHDLGDNNQSLVGYPQGGQSTQFGLKSLRFARDLKVGHCFSIEPGIYFIERLIDKRESDGDHANENQYIDYDKAREYAKEVRGIRFEECYAMTEHGLELLSSEMKPHTVEQVEELRSKAFKAAV